MTKKLLTQEQVNKKYKGKYIEMQRVKSFEGNVYMYEVRKVYKEIHENTTLGEDVGSSMEYCR